MRLYFLFIILLFASEVSAVRINEIMYNPAGDDYDFEFIELYSNITYDISNYYFSGIDFVFPENTTISNYVIVANTCIGNDSDDDFIDRYNLTCDFEYGGTLSNSGETLVLFNPDGGIASQVNYSDTAPENYSLEATLNGWFVSELEGGTPRNENSHPFFVNVDINETNITINFTNSTNSSTETVQNSTENLTIFCDGSIIIETEKDNYTNGEQIKFKHILYNETENYQIEYWIEDLFGEIIKSKRNTTNTNEKSYTPSIKEKEKILLIRSRLYITCNDSNLSDNQYEKLIFVVNTDYEESNKDTTTKTIDKKTETVKITSFYTLSKKFDSNSTIKIFSYISNPGSGFEFSLFLNQNNQLIQTQNLTLPQNGIERITFEPVLKQGHNNFSLELYQGSILRDYKELSLYANQTQKLVDEEAKEKFINTTGLQPDTEKEISEANLNTKSSIAYYIFLGLSVVLNAVLVWKR